MGYSPWKRLSAVYSHNIRVTMAKITTGDAKWLGPVLNFFSVFWNELKWVLMRPEIDIWKGIKNIKELSGAQTLTISYKVMLYKEITYRVDRKAICVQTGQTL